MSITEGTPLPASSGVDFSSNFTAVDYTIFSLMLVVSIGIGIYSAFSSRGKESTQEYMLGGRAMSPYPVALSLLGGVISAISILGNATEMYFFGTQLATSLLGVIPGTIFVNEVMLPIFYNLKIVSLNEYLEIRYKSPALRKLGTLCQAVVSTIYMGMCLYAPSLALSTVTSLTTLNSMVIMGAICTFYITIGGVKAVVYTDVMQTLLMFLGVLAVVIICANDLGGIANVWRIADEGRRLEFFNFDTSPYVRHTFWSVFVLGVYLMVCGIALSQSVYQRFASVSSLRVAKRLSVFFMVGLYTLWTVFFLSGLVAYATYSTCDPLTSGRISKPDQILPFLVTDRLSHLPGLAGVFVAAVYGGVLSSLSSCGNSLACLVWEDFLKDRPYFSRLSNRGATNVVKIISSFTGVLSVGLGALVGSLGNVFHVIISVTAALTGPLSGMFLAGICFPWMNVKGAVAGFTVSFVYGLWVVVGKFVRGGGSPPRLPLSTSQCPETMFNASVSAFLNTTELHNTDLTNSTLGVALADDSLPVEETSVEGSASKTVYDVSYCFSGVICILLTMLVGSVVSFVTGPPHPKELEEGTVNPTCARLYRWVWRRVKGHYEVSSSVKLPDLHPETATDKMLSSDPPDVPC